MGTLHSRILVTGGAGFIGSALVRELIAQTDAEICNVDKLTYAGNLSSLGKAAESSRHHFHRADICDRAAMREIFAQFLPDCVVHLAAESHVDRSIDQAGDFVQSNLVGTSVLLDVASWYWRDLADGPRANFRFHHVSTDEVFGSLGAKGCFDELSPYNPRSPYAATKAGSDQLVRSYYHTHGLPVVISISSNNYGPYQFPEKLIPLAIVRALAGEPVPIYGQGSNVRDWLHVEDHVRALRLVLGAGRAGETYCIGGACERSNLEVAEAVCRELDQLRPLGDGRSHRELIVFVADRPGHDRRYALDVGKIRRELGWVPRENFETGIARATRWYLDNETWWRGVLAGSYRGERLGLRV